MNLEASNLSHHSRPYISSCSTAPVQGSSAGEQRLTTQLRSIVSIAGGSPALSLSIGEGAVNAMALSPDGALVAAAGEDGCLTLFDFASGRRVGGFKVRKAGRGGVSGHFLRTPLNWAIFISRRQSQAVVFALTFFK